MNNRAGMTSPFGCEPSTPGLAGQGNQEERKTRTGESTYTIDCSSLLPENTMPVAAETVVSLGNEGEETSAALLACVCELRPQQPCGDWCLFAMTKGNTPKRTKAVRRNEQAESETRRRQRSKRERASEREEPRRKMLRQTNERNGAQIK